MVIQTWTEILVAALQNVWYGVVSFLPSLLGAIIVLIIGLVVASVVKTLIEKIDTPMMPNLEKRKKPKLENITQESHI